MASSPASSLSCAAAALALLSLASGENYACQVELPVDQPLQDTLGINCSLDESNSSCVCDDNFWSSLHPTWHVITPQVNRSMADDGKPGFWYLTDTSGQCAASFGTGQNPSELACPPGFYCAGHLEPPRSCASGDHCAGQTAADNKRCPAGSFCPFPAAPLMECLDGAVCRAGSTRPDACPAGSYCTAGVSKPCPRGFYCPFACAKPVRCSPFKLCPQGSSHEDASLIAAVFLVVVLVLLYGGAKQYHRFKQSGFMVCAVLAAMIVLMTFISQALGGFLALITVGIAANYALLKIATWPRQVARALMCFSFLFALAVLWRMNPAWCMLCSGLLLCVAACWLMTREAFAFVLVGRGFLVAMFSTLLFVYAHADPTFLFFFGGSTLGIAAWTVIAYVLEEQESSPRALRFVTRWGRQEAFLQDPESHGVVREPSTSFTEETLGSTTSGLFALSLSAHGTVSHGEVAGSAPHVPDATRISVRASPRSSDGHVRGVSFQLDNVGFQLHDGTPLLTDINTSISPGRRVAVMGASGSGKSTLLAVLSGRASYGKVVGRLRVGGEPADDLRFLRHVTGFVPQDDVLHGELTVEENIRFQAQLRLPSSLLPQQVEGHISQVAADLHLTAVRESRVGTPEKRGISGGQRKRASIAMELVAQPLLLFADEPTSGLDSTTAHEVVACLNEAAERLGTTVLSVIHQPRYETLLLFDDLVLLATGGVLVYAGPTERAMASFEQHLKLQFPPNVNPADVMLDAIQLPDASSERNFAALRACNLKGSPAPVAASRRRDFHRDVPPFFRAVLIFMDRAMLQTMRSHPSIIVNQVMLVAVVLILCTILQNSRMDVFLMQSNLATLFLMLLQGVSAQRIFGTDLLITLREARVGMSMIAYLCAKDLASLFEITLSAAVFASSYGTFSGVQQPVPVIFAGAWAFVYSVYGLSYISSICLAPVSAQMASVVAAFVSFCVSGVYQPLLPQMAQYLGGRGWMMPALSPVRWMWGYLITHEMAYLTPLSRKYGAGALASRGYDIRYLYDCSMEGLKTGSTGVVTLREAWVKNRGWVCSVTDMLLLGIIFRFLAGVCLILYLHAQTSRWSQFFGQSEKGLWKLLGKLFTLLVGSFMLLLLFAEVWIFGIQSIDFKQLLRNLGFVMPV